ncbi:MAG: peptidoglycan DD-metalloendopeptidase family protein [Eudoraea sp.]|nr:peptidoglycan DD-metalloendopeptidase family protein [Eudoraea sp.]
MDLSFTQVLVDLASLGRINVLDLSIDPADYLHIDLSRSIAERISYDLSKPDECEAYITSELIRLGRNVACGGYLEERLIYRSQLFVEEGEKVRSIHLGMDFWCKAGTPVYVPVEGVLHGFKDNNDPGNYGPTIILAHSTQDITWYSLYGHLSRGSLKNLEIGQYMPAGSILGKIGTKEENGEYAPHLHFQLIQDLQGMIADYPGVCALKDLEFYQMNCPDPNLLLQI